MLDQEINVVGIGTDVFTDAIKEQGVKAHQLDWKPSKKAEISKRAEEILKKALYSNFKEKIDTANAKIIDIMKNTDPCWIGMKPAIECVPDMQEGIILHSGPDIEWDRMCQTQKEGGINGCLFEGYAKDRDEAEKLLKSGKVLFKSANDYHIVGPGSGIATPSMVVNIVADRNTGVRGFCAPFEGPNRGGLAGWGIFNESIREHLNMVRDIIAPAITKILTSNGGLSMMKIFTRGVEMGDELHSRQDATGLIATNELMKMIFDADYVDDDAKRKCVDLLYGTVRFFHPLGMASAMSLLEAVRNVDYSTVVTAMEGNGVDYGIKVAGLNTNWYTAPSPKIVGEYVSANVDDDDVMPWIGDSCMLEATGLGGFAAAASPAVMRALEKTLSDGIEQTLEMSNITISENAHYLIPALNYQGSPTGIDILKVLDTGIEPVIHGGMISKTGKRLGAGVAYVPIKCFENAILAYGDKYGL